MMSNTDYQTGAHAAQNPATGEVHTHSTQTGARVDQAYQDLKTKIPGTHEHAATNPTTGLHSNLPDTNIGRTQGAGADTGPYPGQGYMNTDINAGSNQAAYPGQGYMSTGVNTEPGVGHGAGAIGTRSHVVEDSSTGEVRTHRTAVGAALDKTAQKVKAAVPGTQAHKNEHGTGTGMGTGTGTGTGGVNRSY